MADNQTHFSKLAITNTLSISDDLTVTDQLKVNGNVVLGNASSDTITFTGLVPTTGKLQFRDTALWIQSSADGVLRLGSDGTITNSCSNLKIQGNSIIATNKKHQLRDTGIYLQSSADGVLDIVSDGTVAVSGTVTQAGNERFATNK